MTILSVKGVKMARRKRTYFEESLQRNMSAEFFYEKRLMELAISMFEWSGLPKSCDWIFMERSLFMTGMAIFFKDEDLPDGDNYFTLRCACHGGFNVYGIPLNRRAYGYANWYQKELTNENSILIYNNMIRTNSIDIVRDYSRKLSLLDRIIEVNANAQKTPVLVTGSETQRLSLMNLYKEFDGNAPVIFGDKTLDASKLQALKTDAPYISDKLYQLKTQIWNEALTYLGISNLSIQKKERLITDEAIRSQGGTIASRYSRLEARRKACEEINEMYGLNVDVDYRHDYRQTDDEYMIENQTEGEDTLTPMVRDLRTRTKIN